MSARDGISDELINAFVDGELAAAERERVFRALDADAAVRERVCALRALKLQLAHAYDVSPPAARAGRAAPRRALAAAALVALGVAFGWLLRMPGSTSDAPGASGVIVHVSSADDARVRAALDTAESLLAQADASRMPLAVEIVANSGGLDALRADASRYAERIARLKARYPNLVFIACGQTIEWRRRLGIDSPLLPGIVTASSALDQVVLRLRAGWRYVGT